MGKKEEGRKGRGGKGRAFVINFYPRDAMLARVFAIATCPSVRPSVRPSAARRYCA